MKTGISGRSAFTLVEIMIVVAIIGLITAIAIPNFIKNRNYAQKNACIKNLSTIEASKQLWGVELGKTDGDIPADSEFIGPDLYLKAMPVCPASGTYEVRSIGSSATCTVAGHTL